MREQARERDRERGKRKREGESSSNTKKILPFKFFENFLSTLFCGLSKKKVSKSEVDVK